jgi:hypothetical protein
MTLEFIYSILNSPNQHAYTVPAFMYALITGNVWPFAVSAAWAFGTRSLALLTGNNQAQATAHEALEAAKQTELELKDLKTRLIRVENRSGIATK